MGFSEVIAETVRRAITQDSWYVDEGTYVLEIQARGLAAFELGLPKVFIVFPLGPEAYTVNRQMRASITPVLGGLVAEERGLLWRDCMVRGTFGISPRGTIDTSIFPDAPPGGSPLLSAKGLSGPGWTRRFVKNYIEKYGELKQNPDTAADVTMIWHDMKTDEHWVIVPESFEIDRNIQRRHHYPYSFRFKAIADASAIPLPKAKANVFSKIKDVLHAVNKAGQLAVAAVQQGSEIVGEVSYYVAAIDSIMDKVGDVTDAANDFVNSVDHLTMQIARTFVTGTIDEMQSALDLMETIEELPMSVRANFQMACDGLDGIAAQRAAFGTTYDQRTKAIASSESGAKRTASTTLDDAAEGDVPNTTALFDTTVVRKSDQDLIDAGVFDEGRTFEKYTGFVPYTVKATDSLPSIAATQMGDGALWYDIAIVNDLKYPYISVTGAPETVAPGATISIPVIGGGSTAAVVGAEQGTEPGLDLLGTDLALEEIPSSQPGRPAVTLAIDKRTYKDIQLISGVPNLEQAIQLRLWTQQGSMPLIPDYGLSRVIGVNATGAELQLLLLSLKSALLQDSRIQQVTAIRAEVDQDVVTFDIDVVPIGESTAQSVSASVT